MKLKFPGRVEQSKPAGTAFSPLDDDAMTNFDDEELDEFKELYDFFVFVARQRLNKNEFESESVASDWVKCWTVLGYTYSSLLTLVTDFLRKKANGLVPFDLVRLTTVSGLFAGYMNKNTIVIFGAYDLLTY